MTRISLLALAAPFANFVAPAAASVVYPRYRGQQHGGFGATPAAAAADPLITTPPVIPKELLLQRRSVSLSLPDCATSCIASAVTNDTDCEIDDYACGCQYSNAAIITSAATACVYTACGYLTAFYAWSTLEDICVTYEYFATTTAAVVTTATTSNTAATTASSSKKGTTATSTAASATETSSSGSSSSSSSTNSATNNSLSTGAIVGIAIGAAGGAIILCALLFLIYRCTGRNKVGGAAAPTAAAAAAAAPAPAPAPSPSPPGAGNAAAVSPMSVAAVPAPAVANAPSAAGHNELDGKSFLAPTVNSTPSGHPNSVSPASLQNVPGYTAADAALWQQQQYVQQQQQQQQYQQQYSIPGQQPYVVQGYSIAPGQAPQEMAVVSPHGYAAAHPSQPVPGVVYQEAGDGTPQARLPQELAAQYQYGSPIPHHAVPVAVGPNAAPPVAPVEAPFTPLARPAAPSQPPM